ncbi:MAG: rRNA maturation RNase YbeY [bacterium]|nr:rRNA maturation RNase YbeY [bacterium]
MKNFLPPRLPYERAAKKILGKSYELDLIFVKSSDMKNLNKHYRKLNKSTNVLSFALSPAFGQLVFDPNLIKKEAKSSGKPFRKYLWRLFLHGLLHLKGFQHGRKMDAAESKIKI